MAVARKKDCRFTYADYVTWPENERWELIDGQPYDMSPAPTTRHQRILSNLHVEFHRLMKGHPCTLFFAPTDVVFSEHDVVQPDLLVVCDQKKITEANIQGAPDLIVEILSPTTSLKDKREKFALYKKFGVKEYLVVHPTENHVERFFFAGAHKRFAAPELFGKDDTLVLASIKGVKIALKAIFLN